MLRQQEPKWQFSNSGLCPRPVSSCASSRCPRCIFRCSGELATELRLPTSQTPFLIKCHIFYPLLICWQQSIICFENGRIKSRELRTNYIQELHEFLTACTETSLQGRRQLLLHGPRCLFVQPQRSFCLSWCREHLLPGTTRVDILAKGFPRSSIFKHSSLGIWGKRLLPKCQQAAP